MAKLYAQPYSNEHTGFYFESMEEFDSGMEQLNNSGCEEVEIQFIDGDTHHSSLFSAASINQSTVSFWFDELEDLTTNDAIRICFLLDLGMSLSDALNRYDEVCLHYGTARDYAQELIEETTEIPENLRYYIDYKAIARDMCINGDIVKIEHDLIITNANEF